MYFVGARCWGELLASCTVLYSIFYVVAARYVGATVLWVIFSAWGAKLKLLVRACEWCTNVSAFFTPNAVLSINMNKRRWCCFVLLWWCVAVLCVVPIVLLLCSFTRGRFYLSY